MTDCNLGIAEKTFIIHGIQGDMREDGRGCSDYRHMEVTTGVISHANGSARLKLANTDVLVGIKAEVCAPDVGSDDCGFIEFFVDCSANATPIFEGKGGDNLATEIVNFLARVYETKSCMDMKTLCISRGTHVWKLHIDIVVMEFGGNVMDAVSVAVKAALFDLRLPVVKVTVDGDITDIEVSDDPSEVMSLDVSLVPVLITLYKVSHCHVVDATVKEEACSMARLTMAVDERGAVVFSSTCGSGSLQPKSIMEMLQTGKTVGQEINKKLMSSLLNQETTKNQDSISTFLYS